MDHFKKHITFTLLFVLLLPIYVLAGKTKDTTTLSLNGEWQMGFSRKYTRSVNVPGIHSDPTRIGVDTLWYKKTIKLPKGSWTAATLELKGARFRPKVYINGTLVGDQEGGMAPLFFTLNNSDIKPGGTITLEIALAPLKNVPQTDASYTPMPDQWRSDVSSSLWDDVALHLHGDVRISRIIPVVNYQDQKVSARFDLYKADSFSGTANLQIINDQGKILISQTKPIQGSGNAIDIALNGKLKSWSPQQPNLYHLKLTITNAEGKLMNASVIPFGLKEFKIRDKQFYLNNEHFVARGVTVVWHRWVRTAEGRDLGYDTAWFKKISYNFLKIMAPIICGFTLASLLRDCLTFAIDTDLPYSTSGVFSMVCRHLKRVYYYNTKAGWIWP